MDEILEKLKNYPRFRERKEKDIFISILVARKLGLVQGEVKPSTTVSIPFTEYPKFLQLSRTYDRYWRAILKSNESMRGTDYDQKEDLENDTLEDLGYKPLTASQADKALKEI